MSARFVVSKTEAEIPQTTSENAENLESVEGKVNNGELGIVTLMNISSTETAAGSNISLFYCGV